MGYEWVLRNLSFARALLWTTVFQRSGPLYGVAERRATRQVLLRGQNVDLYGDSVNAVPGPRLRMPSIFARIGSSMNLAAAASVSYPSSLPRCAKRRERGNVSVPTHGGLRRLSDVPAQ